LFKYYLIQFLNTPMNTYKVGFQKTKQH